MTISKQMFADFERHWWQLQDANLQKAESTDGLKPLVPIRSSFNPMRIPALLPYISLLERKGPYNIEARLSGTAVDKDLPAGVIKDNMFDYLEPHMLEFCENIYQAICSRPCGVYYERTVHLNTGDSFKLCRNCLPLADKDGTIKFMIGVAYAETDSLKPFPPNIAYTRMGISYYEYIDLGYGVPDMERIPSFLPGGQGHGHKVIRNTH
ncbi:PAS domain-containing protein [Kordiimonas pumila]|uniref:PAS domain-containing protein n=1 Tax=Kordiimonas pumila TaxID=2161677 RepID=A0ABV7D3B2_9PROT|nr:PAS domain-containing protein [Kordiimonas pumila]